jgi:ribonuclease VapC
VIVDSSAVLAILLDEPERDAFLDALAAATSARMSAASYVECGAVLDRRGGPQLGRQFDALLAAAEIEVADVTAEQAQIARAAYRDYGRGSGHPAGLNFGDCFAYALASATGEPLLFKGEDFAHTEVRPAIE